MTEPSADDGVPLRRNRAAWVTRLLLLGVAVAVVVALVRAYRRVDLDEVWEAMGHLEWWHVPVLVGVLLLRQVLNAAPLAIYIPGAGFYRATINDLSAATASSFAPPPSDMVLRVTMFRSWGFDVSRALAATTMNALTMFIMRFGAPLVGFLLLPFLGVPLGLRALDIVSLLVAAGILGGVLLVVRGETQAAQLGHRVAGVVRRLRKDTDPEAWATTFATFQQNIADGFPRRFPRALLATLAMMTADLLLLTLALRFVGVGAAEASLLVIAAAFFFAYPLTLFPMQGIGLLDAAIVAALVESAGAAVTEPAIAGLIIWRVFTIAGPLALGAGAIVVWRGSTRDARPRSTPAH
ncbi:flippase-like domain-containing protein [Ornithinimicrobium sp. F0845]|uniref:lysylphosphatidylglycerol synthase domain-containing protein n=1 Tax=Ornithinimicrobium sp. F0845 TaxID=2926412 RepID=UPI001FF52175|nr:lysylphosphatidylglycerol synthase domain-containing protein [Ornithinimicrobium sp. F0845]MCK0112605.1 flippase-like domain-containing protein [Ornithinimicrobium sp. F0845]